MTTIKIPRINQSATEAVLIEWRAKPGEQVEAGQPIALIETDKSEIEVESPIAGTFHPEAQPGGTYAVGEAIAQIQAKGEAIAQIQAKGEAIAQIQAKGETSGSPEPGVRRAPTGAASGDGRETSRAEELPDVSSARVYASPKARRLAREQGVDLSAIASDHMITASDLASATESTWQGRKIRERRSLEQARQRVAQATSNAWKAPHFTQFIDVDLTKLAALRPAWKDVTWTTLFVAALARALAATPELNAAIDGDTLILFDNVNIGIAVDTDRGLLVPVIADADTRTLKALAAAVKRANDDHAGDPVGASATVSNLGIHGIRAGTPVLNSPEPVLLFAGAVEDRAIVVDKDITIRTMVTLSLAFDHRVTDGAPAARFAASVRQILENPERHL